MEELLVKNISKTFGKKLVLDKFCFSFKLNNIYSIVGENGAGKTTLLKIITRLIKSDNGFLNANLSIFGTIEENGFINGLSIEENFDLLLPDNFTKDEYFFKIIKTMGVDSFLTIKFKKCSQGMKQRAILTLALLQKTKVLLFDEPTNALDPIVIEKFKSLLIEQKQNRIFIICSHDLYFLNSFVDVVIFLKEGKLDSFYEPSNFGEIIKIKVKENEKFYKFLCKNHIFFEKENNYFILDNNIRNKKAFISIEKFEPIQQVVENKLTYLYKKVNNYEETF